MTKKQAKDLYCAVAKRFDNFNTCYTDEEWNDIQVEMGLVVNAKSDGMAARVIRHWNCWDRKLSAMKCARAFREQWKAMNKR